MKNIITAALHSTESLKQLYLEKSDQEKVLLMRNVNYVDGFLTRGFLKKK